MRRQVPRDPHPSRLVAAETMEQHHWLAAAADEILDVVAGDVDRPPLQTGGAQLRALRERQHDSWKCEIDRHAGCEQHEQDYEDDPPGSALIPLIARTRGTRSADRFC